jgi:hypothetical protein
MLFRRAGDRRLAPPTFQCQDRGRMEVSLSGAPHLSGERPILMRGSWELNTMWDLFEENRNFALFTGGSGVPPGKSVRILQSPEIEQ